MLGNGLSDLPEGVSFANEVATFLDSHVESVTSVNSLSQDTDLHSSRDGLLAYSGPEDYVESDICDQLYFNKLTTLT